MTREEYIKLLQCATIGDNWIVVSENKIKSFEDLQDCWVRNRDNYLWQNAKYLYSEGNFHFVRLIIGHCIHGYKQITFTEPKKDIPVGELKKKANLYTKGENK